MSYHQITREERYTLQQLLRQRSPVAYIAEVLGRHRSTIYREIRRNATQGGHYRASHAQGYSNTRRSRSRRNYRITDQDWCLVDRLLREEDWSPEQIGGRLGLCGRLRISHETIYLHVWADKRSGGRLYRHLRQSGKLRRKRHGSNDSRGRVDGKRPIEERPAGATNRSRVGHWEADTMLGRGKPCVLTLVERKTGYLQIGKLNARTATELNRKAIQLIRRQRRPVRTVTADNGTEFHAYASIETETDTRFYFAKPYHSWERGTNENTNGLIRQYLPKRRSMVSLSQSRCDAIAQKLNSRPRKRLGYLTPEECYTRTQARIETDACG